MIIQRPNSTFGLQPTALTDRIGMYANSFGVSGVDSGAHTMCAWFRRTGFEGGAYENLLSLNNSGYCETYLNSGVFYSYNDTTFSVSSGVTVPIDGKWFFAAQTGEHSVAQISYLATSGTAKWDVVLSRGPESFGHSDCWFATETDNQWLDGEVACMRIWRRPLRSDELLLEMRSMTAVSRNQLVFDCRGADRLNRATGLPLIATGAVVTGTRELRLGQLPKQYPYFKKAAAAAASGGRVQVNVSGLRW